ncbi:MAG: hypothetical protein J7K68_00590, partial [Candidatus Diapherotrites archaeon]|nr:hypothetical protein [Candidatus Diapherotrites archaeon]
MRSAEHTEGYTPLLRFAYPGKPHPPWKKSRAISPIVSVVLLIAIATIAAVGLYFWVGGYATKQPTTETPISIYAIP